MTDESMTLIDLAEKHADGDYLRALGQYVLQELMELEAQAKCGARTGFGRESDLQQVNGHDFLHSSNGDQRIRAFDLVIRIISSKSNLAAVVVQADFGRNRIADGAKFFRGAQ